MAIDHTMTLRPYSESLDAVTSSLTHEHPEQKAEEVKRQRTTRFSVISLFAGCGGMDLGFKGGFTFHGKHYTKLPFRLDWANEINENACRTYRRNIGKHIHHGDIWDHLDRMPTEADVVIGGFPCQDISVNGKGAGIQGERSGLYRAMVEAVSIAKPMVFVAENVK